MVTNSFSRILICSILILKCCQDGVIAQSKPCTLPRKEPGTCVAIQRCRNIYKIVINPTEQNKIYDAYIEKAACTLPGVTRSICCQPREVVHEQSRGSRAFVPTVSKRDLLPKNCGQIASDRIAYGNVTKVFAYPWMAVLRYKEKSEIVERCGGSLINERYVLTAAHCIKTRNSSKLHSVILGEHTKNQSVDCNIYRNNNGDEMDRDCAEPIEIFGIESIEIHQNYNQPRYAHDIGLIRLNRDVTMKEHIKPICLPITANLQTQAFDNYIVTGWGTTETETGSDVLLEAIQYPVAIEMCQQELSRNWVNILLSDKQMCARGNSLAESCRGDSGGPLISSASYNGARFVQFGIVSAGINSCGHNIVPGVYCRVASYMNWILDHIEPSN